jgi:hypothetical protein
MGGYDGVNRHPSPSVLRSAPGHSVGPWSDRPIGEWVQRVAPWRGFYGHDARSAEPDYGFSTFIEMILLYNIQNS